MSYRDRLRAYSPAGLDCPDLEETGQIRLPEAVLTAVMQGDNVPAVMLFEIRNPRLGAVVYAGVRDFTTPPGQCCVPYWMMEYLQISEGDVVMLTLTTLPTATRALFQPQDKKFLDIPNPKVVLEYTLRKYPCLTQGTMLKINFNKKIYHLKVLKTEPGKAVATLRADVICDFATPVSDFDHDWLKSDTDSSDDGEAHKPIMGRTTKGDTIVEQPKPMRSTFAQREKDRRTKQNVAGVTRIEAGREILPPKPKEAVHKKKKEETMFTGQGRLLKKGKQDAASAAAKEKEKEKEKQPARPATALEPERKPVQSMFTGQARSLRDSGPPAGGRTPAPAPAPAAAPAPAQAARPSTATGQKPAEEKKNPFMGTPRSLR